MPKTVLLLRLVSKATKTFRVGDMAIRAGEVPALISLTDGKVSFLPLMILRPPKLKVDVTPCDASTRFRRRLGGRYPLVPYPPQETRVNPAHNSTRRTAETRMRLFKLKAPKNLKKEDLNV